MHTNSVDYHHELLEQITFHRAALWDRRLAGLTDEEYFWSPVPGGSHTGSTHSAERSSPGC